MTDEAYKAANTIWRYMRLSEKPMRADCLVVLGSRDDRVAAYAAELVKEYVFDTVLVTGGLAHRNDLLATTWELGSEAEHFADIMQRNGVKKEILLEKKATNTGENALFTYQLLEKKGISPSSLLLVTKPYMERRALATFEKQWPRTRTQLQVTSPAFTFELYCNDEQPTELVLNIMVGDLQRIIEYPKLGLQTPQVVPDEVMDAYLQLVRAGFTKHLL